MTVVAMLGGSGPQWLKGGAGSEDTGARDLTGEPIEDPGDLDEEDLEELPEGWADDAPADLPPLRADAYLLVRPGEAIEEVDRLPKPKRLGKAVAVSLGDLVLNSATGRTVCRTPHGHSSAGDVPAVTRLVVVHIRKRSSPPRTRHRRYLIATDRHDELLGWLDDSEGWELEAASVAALAAAADIECEVEVYGTEPEFEDAHPEWVGGRKRRLRRR